MREILSLVGRMAHDSGIMSSNAQASLETLIYLRVRLADPVYRRVTINTLPDDALVEIFSFYVDQTDRDDSWYALVHVCRKWRYVVFASPRRLRLRLLCTPDQPVEKMLHIWPALPIVLVPHRKQLRKQGVNNIIHALKHHDRVYRIDLWVTNPLLKKMAATKEPFPALTYLELRSGRATTQILPDSFLGGSAPRLRFVFFYGIAYPGLRKLLSSTRDIVHLRLHDIPYSGYISPEATATCLSALTRIEEVSLHFRSPRYDIATQGRSQLQHTPFVLPALRDFFFTGDSDYLERIITPINAPVLTRLYIKFFNQLVFGTPSLRRLIGRTEASRAFCRVDVSFSKGFARLGLWVDDFPSFELGISSRMLDWQLSSVAQLCSSSLPPMPALECLKIFQDRQHLQDDIEDIQWLELLHPFTRFASVKDLVLSGPLVQHVARALQKVSGERLIEVLPMPQPISQRVGRLQPEEHIQEPFRSWSLPDSSLVFP